MNCKEHIGNTTHAFGERIHITGAVKRSIVDNFKVDPPLLEYIIMHLIDKSCNF